MGGRAQRALRLDVGALAPEEVAGTCSVAELGILGVLNLVPVLELLLLPRLFKGEDLVDEVFDLASLDFLRREVLAVVRVDLVHDARHLRRKSLGETATPRDRNSECHRVRVLADFNVMEEPFAR